MDVWLFLDPAKEDIEKASDEIDQGEIGGMDMDGFPGTGGDEPTDGPQSPEDGEQVETAVQMTKDAGGLKHAVLDNCIDINGDEHDELGWFTGSNSVRSKMPLTTSGKKPKGIGGGSGQNYQKPQKIDLSKGKQKGKIVKQGVCVLGTPGFGSQIELDEHWKDHGWMYPGWTKAQYQDHAVWLASQKCESGQIRGFESGNVVVRYDTQNNDFVKADVDTDVITMFKPTDGAAYYEYQRKGGATTPCLNIYVQYVESTNFPKKTHTFPARYVDG